ncbi:MAG: MFS transporter [Sphaerobacter sp.]|nr:MFS transporter [Sphaerobacter sp.]
MGRAGHSFGLLRRNRDFAALWAAELFSTLGDRVHRVALAALVFRLTGDLTETGIAFVATALPDLLFGLVAGTFVDRWDRRRAMVACNLLRVPAVLLIPMAAHVHLWLAYAILLWVNTLAIVSRPAKTAMLPSLVKPDELHAANSLSGIMENAADVLGYPLGGILVGTVSAWLGAEQGLLAAFAFDGLMFILAALCVASIRHRGGPQVATAAASLWDDVREGIAFAWRHPLVRANTLVMLLGPLTLGAAWPLLVGYAWDVLGGGEREYALLGTGISVGSVLAGVWLTRLPAGRTGLFVIGGLVIMGLGVMGTAAVSHLWLAVALIAVSGVGSMMVLVPSVTLIQRHTPDGLLGRVFAVRSTLIFAATIVANALGGMAGERFGVQRSLFASGAALVALVLLAALFPSVRASEGPSLLREEPQAAD